MRHLLLFLLFVFTVQYTFGQETGIQLSTPYPQQGQRIWLTYNGSPNAVKSKPLYLYVHFSYRRISYYINMSKYIPLHATGGVWKGQLLIPKRANSFCILLFKGPAANRDWQMIYNGMVYNQQKPVEHAWLSILDNIRATEDQTKIKTDTLTDLTARANEYKLYPKSEENQPDNDWRPQEVSKDYIDKKIAEFDQSNNEKTMLMAAGLIRGQGKPQQADSLLAVIKRKFPAAATVRKEALTAFNTVIDPLKKEAMLNAYFAKYPGRPANEKIWMRTELMRALIRIDNNRYKIQAGLLNDEELAKSLNDIAGDWAAHGFNYKRDEELSKQSIAIASKLVIKSKTDDDRNYYQDAYQKYTTTYAFILRKQNKFFEAKAYLDTLYRYDKSPDAKYDESYVLTLIGLGQKVKALAAAFRGRKAGVFKPIMLDTLKETYIEVNGSDANYDADWEEADSLYFVNRSTHLKHNLRLWKKEMRGEMINEEAPPLMLKNLEGKTVSLTELKGKTVLVVSGPFGAMKLCGP